MDQLRTQCSPPLLLSSQHQQYEILHFAGFSALRRSESLPRPRTWPSSTHCLSVSWFSLGSNSQDGQAAIAHVDSDLAFDNFAQCQKADFYQPYTLINCECRSLMLVVACSLSTLAGLRNMALSPRLVGVRDVFKGSPGANTCLRCSPVVLRLHLDLCQRVQSHLEA